GASSRRYGRPLLPTALRARRRPAATRLRGALARPVADQRLQLLERGIDLAALGGAVGEQRPRPVVQAVGLLELAAQEGRGAELIEALRLIALAPERHAEQAIRLVEVAVEAGRPRGVA